jgi:hypothetical protein
VAAPERPWRIPAPRRSESWRARCRRVAAWLEGFEQPTDATFVDLAQGVTATGRDEIRAYGQTWIDALSDAAYADVRITDAGDTVTMQFNGEG